MIIPQNEPPLLSGESKKGGRINVRLRPGTNIVAAAGKEYIMAGNLAKSSIRNEKDSL